MHTTQTSTDVEVQTYHRSAFPYRVVVRGIAQYSPFLTVYRSETASRAVALASLLRDNWYLLQHWRTQASLAAQELPAVEHYTAKHTGSCPDRTAVDHTDRVRSLPGHPDAVERHRDDNDRTLPCTVPAPLEDVCWNAGR